MRCREARAAIVETGSRWPVAAAGAELREHLSVCRDCSAEAAVERRLRDEISSLRGEYPHEIDVRTRVVRRIAELGRIDREEVTTGQLGWATSFAAACVVGLLAGGWILWSDAAPGLREGLETLPTLFGPLGALAQPLLKLASVPFKLLGVALKLLGAFGSLVSELEPVGITVVAFCYAAMAATIALVVGRDLKRPLPAVAREDR
jgi:hypothetical protein